MADGLELLSTTLSLTCALLLAFGPLLLLLARIRVRVRRPLPSLALHPPLGGVLPLIGLTLTLSSPVAAEPRRSAVPPPRLRSAAPPWSSTGGDPPPRPPVEAKAPPWQEVRKPHPAIHGHPGKIGGALFPRVAKHAQATSPGIAGRSGCDERAACMARHPAGKGRIASSTDPSPVQSPVTRADRGRERCSHVVRPGDTLWGLAAEVLDTDDPRRIARYWPRIHKANRDVIGSNPDRLFPGQVLELPDPCE